MKPFIRKIGTIDCDIVETTPVVFNGRLYRFEYIRKHYYANSTGNSYFRFVDAGTGETSPPFGKGYHLGSAFVDGDTVYAFGVDSWGGRRIRTFISKDMESWESYVNICLDGGTEAYNNSVCRNSNGKFIMLVELGNPREETGVSFTPRFLESEDLLNWRLLPPEYIFGQNFYTGGHFLTFESGFYYMTYLHALPTRAYETRIVRSRDLVDWESSPLNPFMTFSGEDRLDAAPRLPKIQKDRIAKAVNINSSDQEFCEFRGKTVIYYSWGNQEGTEFLAEAVYEGALKSLVEGFFPGGNPVRANHTKTGP